MLPKPIPLSIKRQTACLAVALSLVGSSKSDNAEGLQFSAPDLSEPPLSPQPHNVGHRTRLESDGRYYLLY